MTMRPRYRWSRVLGVGFGVVGLLAGGDAAAQTGRIYGRVVDAENGDAVRGATVVADNPSAVPDSFTAVSDNKGRYAMLGLRSGNWVLTAGAPGYLPVRGAARVQTIGSVAPIDFKLQKAPPLPPSPFDGVDVKALQQDLLAANSLLDGSRTAEAITAYTSILEKLPALTMVRLQLGHAYRRQNDLDRALEEFQKVPEDDERYSVAQVEIGTLELARGNLDAAERALTRAATANAPTPEALCALGEVKLAAARPDEAAEWFRKAVAADASWPRPYVKLGLVSANTGDMPAAVEYLEKAIALDHDGADAQEARRLLEQLRR
jgi:tetratricopeptide (TPR) repeat protein